MMAKEIFNIWKKPALIDAVRSKVGLILSQPSYYDVLSENYFDEQYKLRQKAIAS